MSKRRFGVCGRIVLAGGMMIGLGLLASGQEKERKAPVSAHPAATKTAPAPAKGSGLKAFIDPVTGQLRPGEQEELNALSAASLQAGTPGEPVALQHPSGAVGMRLTDDQMVYSVATLGPDGKLKMECVNGKKKAEDRVKTPARQGGLDVR